MTGIGGLFGVIDPTYWRPAFLAEAIRSVLAPRRIPNG
jgi:hypothetical protein